MISYIELERITPNPWQTRGDAPAEYIQELAEDIATNGLLQTPLGRQDGDQVQLAFGHNRLAAFKVLATRGETLPNGTVSPWLRLPVDIKTLTDEQMAMMAWSENEKRRDLTPVERARAVSQRMMDFSWTQEQAAAILGLSRTTVANILRLLDLPDEIQLALSAGDISERSAMALLPLYEVPAEIRAKAEWTYYSPKKIVGDALGGASSDAIRKGVNELFSRAFVSLDGSNGRAAFGLDTMFPEGGAIYCGLCRTCDRRLASRNLCMDRDCYEAKIGVVRHRYLEKAAGASGYDVIDQHKGGYPSMLPSDPTRLEKILQTKCKNLRLAYDVSGNGRDDPRRISGHLKALLVCDKRNDSCTCVKGLGKLAELERSSPASGIRPAILADFVPEDLKGALGDGIEEEPPVKEETMPIMPTPAQLEDVMRQARKDKKDAVEKTGEIRQALETLLAEELANDAPGALYVLITGYIPWTLRDVPSVEKLYKDAARQLAGKFLPNNYDSVAQVIGYVNGRLDALGLPQISLVKRLAEVFEEEVEG